MNNDEEIRPIVGCYWDEKSYNKHNIHYCDLIFYANVTIVNDGFAK